MGPNICSTWEPLQALASCTSLHWSISIASAGNWGKSQQLLGLSGCRSCTLTMTPSSAQQCCAGFHLLLLESGKCQGRIPGPGQCSGFLSLVSCHGAGVAAAQGCELPSGPLRLWWRSCSSQPCVLAALRQCPSLWSCCPLWQVVHHKEHLRVAHEAQESPGLRLSCATVKPAKVALQWSWHSVRAQTDLAASASAACHPGQPPQPLHPNSTMAAANSGHFWRR